MKHVIASILSGVFWLFVSIVLSLAVIVLLSIFAIGMALLFGGKLT